MKTRRQGDARIAGTGIGNILTADFAVHLGGGFASLMEPAPATGRGPAALMAASGGRLILSRDGGCLDAGVSTPLASHAPAPRLHSEDSPEPVPPRRLEQASELKVARLHAELIAKAGAVMVTAHPVVRCTLLGHIAWLGDHHCFWIEVSPEGEGGARVFEYDELCRIGHRGVAFFRMEQIVALLCPITAPVVGRRTDYVQRYEAWVRVLAARQEVVCGLCDLRHLRHTRRTCAWHLPRCAVEPTPLGAPTASRSTRSPVT